METVSLTIDGKEIKAKEGEKVLWAALRNGIYIPHLCAIPESPLPFGGCRLCFVEIEGRGAPVNSCTEPVREGMVVQTKTEKVLRLVRTAFELILSTHPLNCKDCPANKRCALQDIARQMGFKLKSKRFRKITRQLPIDDSQSQFTLNPNLCVFCGQCVYVCNEVVKVGAINFNFRGLNAQVGTFGGEPLAESGCTSCLKCVEVCPVGAFSLKEK